MSTTETPIPTERQPLSPGERREHWRRLAAAGDISTAAIYDECGWFCAAEAVAGLREKFPELEDRERVVDLAISDIDDRIAELEDEIVDLKNKADELEDAKSSIDDD